MTEHIGVSEITHSLNGHSLLNKYALASSILTDFGHLPKCYNLDTHKMVKSQYSALSHFCRSHSAAT